MKNLKDIVSKRINTLGMTKEFVANKLDMSRVGFWQSLENSTLNQKKLSILFDLLNIEPNYFFDWKKEIDLNQFNEPEIKYKNKNDIKIDIVVTEVDFLRLQVTKLTAIIENLSKVIDIKNIS
jgi:hypothetical protein